MPEPPVGNAPGRPGLDVRRGRPVRRRWNRSCPPSHGLQPARTPRRLSTRRYEVRISQSSSGVDGYHARARSASRSFRQASHGNPGVTGTSTAQAITPALRSYGGVHVAGEIVFARGAAQPRLSQPADVFATECLSAFGATTLLTEMPQVVSATQARGQSGLDDFLDDSTVVAEVEIIPKDYAENRSDGSEKDLNSRPTASVPSAPWDHVHQSVEKKVEDKIIVPVSSASTYQQSRDFTYNGLPSCATPQRSSWFGGGLSI